MTTNFATHWRWVINFWSVALLAVKFAKLDATYSLAELEALEQRIEALWVEQ